MNPPPPMPQAPRLADFPCRKCGGSGNVGYRRVGGVCFKCGGDGVNQAALQDAQAAHALAYKEWEAATRSHAETEAARLEAEWAARGEPTDLWERMLQCLSITS